MKAIGWGAWINQYATLPDAKLVARAQQCDFVIVKYGQWREFDLLKRAGVRLGIERYCYPGQAFTEGQMLAEGIGRGAEFAVVNAEVEWEFNGADVPMRQLITELRRQHPSVEVYGCTDTRSYRFARPYQRVLAELATGWMPMIYPKEFQQTAAAAFASSLGGKDFGGKPVLPAIQTYNGAGAALVTAQVEEAVRRGLPGCQAYTIGHATDAEWAAFIANIPKEDDVTKEEVLAMLTYTAAVLRNEIKAGFDQQGNLLKLGLTGLDARVKKLEGK